jgi:hypothetical protein
MPIADLDRVVGNLDEKKEISEIVKLISGGGESKRLSSLFPNQSLFIFEMLALHKVYFSNKYKKSGEEGMIPLLMKTYMSLGVSETNRKDSSLLQGLTEMYKFEMLNRKENEQAKV